MAKLTQYRLADKHFAVATSKEPFNRLFTLDIIENINEHPGKTIYTFTATELIALAKQKRKKQDQNVLQKRKRAIKKQRKEAKRNGR